MQKSAFVLLVVTALSSLLLPACSKKEEGPTPAQIAASCTVVCHDMLKGCPGEAKGKPACEKTCSKDAASLAAARECGTKGTAAAATRCAVVSTCMSLPK